LTADEVSIVHDKIEGTRISPKELQMAESLVKGMTSARFRPEKYRDTYYNDVMRLIRQKVKGGKSVEVAAPAEEAEQPAAGAKVLDLMPLLKQSLEGKGGRKSHGGQVAHAKRSRKGKGGHGHAHA
jgi:DNA end-binding protein Ku